jgi:hypothetical protein
MANTAVRARLQGFVRLGRGKCTGCDMHRVLYRYEWYSGRIGFEGRRFSERYCQECLFHQANKELSNKE